MAAVRFLNVHYYALHFHTKINSLKVLFRRERGGKKNEYSVYAFDNVDSSGRPLRWTGKHP